MSYNFDRVVDRTHTYDLKWNKETVAAKQEAPLRQDFIPMWIADTDFACPPHVVEALSTRVSKEIFGYSSPMSPFFDAVCWWQQQRHGWRVLPEWISGIPTVVAGVNIAIRATTDVGDGVIIQPPVYDPFARIIEMTGRQVVCNNLLRTAEGYRMDYDQLDKLAAEPRNKLLVLCSPHNPVGRSWTAEELCRLADICLKHGVTMISDEIHSDIVFGGKHHPLPALSEKYAEHTILLTAPSKTFNVPGLKAGLAIIPNVKLKQSFDNQCKEMSLDIHNTFGLEGVIACYSPKSEPWLTELLAYIEGNFALVEQFLQQHLPKITMRRPEGSYLCWLDCSALGLSDDALLRRMSEDAGVIFVAGTWFGSGGEGHLRMNVGCTRATLQRALERMAAVL